MEAAAAGDRVRTRAGSQALSVFAYALNARVLRGHSAGPLRYRELRETIGWAPPTSLRKSLANLCELGALARRQAGNGSKPRSTELTEAGRDLLVLADRLERWLQCAPAGPVALDSPSAIGVVRVLLGGWDAGIVRALAEGPLTAGEMLCRIGGIGPDSLERRVRKMRATDLVVRAEPEGRRKPLAATRWLRHALAPLSVACHWERRHVAAPVPLGRAEARACCLLLAPLLELPAEADGICSLELRAEPARVGDGREPRVDRIALAVREGRVEACAAAAPDPSGRVLGTVDGWLRAIAAGDRGELRIGGADAELPALLVQRMHDVLRRPWIPVA